MRNEETIHEKNVRKRVNLVIVTVGIIAVMLTGAVYASKLQQVDVPSANVYDKNTVNHK